MGRGTVEINPSETGQVGGLRVGSVIDALPSITQRLRDGLRPGPRKPDRRRWSDRRGHRGGPSVVFGSVAWAGFWAFAAIEVNALAATGLANVDGEALNFSPHDF